MIYVKNNGLNTYEPDIRALINSFYPGEEIVHVSGLESAVKHPADKDAFKAVYLDVDRICHGIEREEDRFRDKNNIKRAVYNALSELAGSKLPWGTLTGIRPVRILERYGPVLKNREELRAKLKEEFLISEDKLRLSETIYDNELRALSSIDYKNGYSVYIGIPFCPTRCVYCSFTSYPLGLFEDKLPDYIAAVEKELASIERLERTEGSVLYGKKLQTVYVGGGTPSVLSPELTARLIDGVKVCLDTSWLKELTFEAGRPDTIDMDKLTVLKQLGVDRISINPQTMNEGTLKAIGREHSVDDIREAFLLARKAGFDNINMDVIAGLPGEGIKEFEHTLSEIGKLDPESLTVHTLAVKRASRLNMEGNAWGGVERKGLDKEGASDVSRMVELGKEYALKRGLEPYYLYRQKNMAGNLENTGYARRGKESLYNILMMEEKHTVIGIGAGSSTKLVAYDGEAFKDNSVRRFENTKDLKSYLTETESLIKKREAFFELQS